MWKAFTTVALLTTASASAVAPAQTCRLELSGADHLRRQDPVTLAQILGQVESFLPTTTPARVRAAFIDVFGPDEIKAALTASGAPPAQIQAVGARVDRFVQRIYGPGGGEFPLLYNAVEFLLASHDPAKTHLNLCVLGQACPPFQVRNVTRPYLPVAVLGSVHVTSLEAPLPQYAPVDLNFNVVFVRPGGDPDLFVADMFAGLGAATIMHVVRLWAVTRWADPTLPTDLLFGRFGRLRGRIANLDLHFVEFMKTMGDHVASLEYQKLTGFTSEQLRAPGRPGTVERAFGLMSEGTRRAMAANGVTEANAVDTFNRWFAHLRTRINAMPRRGPL